MLLMKENAHVIMPWSFISLSQPHLVFMFPMLLVFMLHVFMVLVVFMLHVFMMLLVFMLLVFMLLVFMVLVVFMLLVFVVLLVFMLLVFFRMMIHFFAPFNFFILNVNEYKMMRAKLRGLINQCFNRGVI
jgi:hypothetical protein